MNWTGFLLLSAVFLALYDLAKKASVRENAVLPVLLCSTSFGCLAFTLGLVACGQFNAVCASVNGRVLALSTAKAIIVAISWIFTFCALRTLPITIATPIRASSPALVFVIALFLYGEIPSWIQAVGMVAVFVGYWVFSWAGRYEGINFFRNRAVWCAIAGACCSAVSSILDKYVFQIAAHELNVAAPIAALQFFFQIMLVVLYATFWGGQYVLRLPRAHFQWRWTIPFVGTFLAVSDCLLFNGLSFPDVPVSVAALLRRFSVVLTFILGAKFFHETNLKRKSVALAVVVVGVILLCI